MPVGLSLGMVGLLGLSVIRGFEAGLGMLGIQYFRIASTYAFSVVPLFVAMGYLATQVKISDDIFYVIEKWIGHWRGGLAMATTAACAIFAAICGDPLATATTVGSVTLPIMREKKYKDVLSLGCLAAGGNLGFLIPPSLGFVFYAILTEQAIGTLFIAGILPGFLLTIIFILTIWIMCARNHALGPKSPSANWKDRLISLRYISTSAILIIMVLGGIYGGIFTPTEAAGVGVFGVIVIGIFKRRFTWRGLKYSLLETAKLAGKLLILIAGALMFTRFLTVTEIPGKLAEILGSLDVSPYFILAIVLGFYIFIGCIMDIMSIIFLSAPVLHFILTGVGFDPVLVSVLTMITILMGHISPPVGVMVYGLSAYVQDVPVFLIFRGAAPFLLSMLVCLIILIIFPQITLVLPNAMIPG
jgi:tripartite ATP-independent transporter DctM subunit